MEEETFAVPDPVLGKGTGLDHDRLRLARSA